MSFDFLDRFLKTKNKSLLYVIFIIGIALMLFSGNKQESAPAAVPSYSEEESLEKVIAGISSAGKVEVMITYYGSPVNNIVYDTKERGEGLERTAVISDGKAVSSGTSYPRVKGVVVVASGARSQDIRKKILNAVTVALDVPEYKVAVIS